MHFTMFHKNIRGIKSKVDPLTEAVEDTNPTMICIVETRILKEEEIAIPGYETVFRKDGLWNIWWWNSGGIMIAVKDNIKTISM